MPAFSSEERSRPKLPLWLWPPLFVLGWLSAAHNSVAIAVRLVFSSAPFAIVYWSMLRGSDRVTASVRAWQVICAALCVHIAALCVFWGAVKDMDIWLLAALLALETGVIAIFVANDGFPAQRKGLRG